jgi:hypothetical protein
MAIPTTMKRPRRTTMATPPQPPARDDLDLEMDSMREA